MHNIAPLGSTRHLGTARVRTEFLGKASMVRERHRTPTGSNESGQSLIQEKVAVSSSFQLLEIVVSIEFLAGRGHDRPMQPLGEHGNNHFASREQILCGHT